MEINNLNDIRKNIDGLVLSKNELAIKQLHQIIDYLPIEIKTLIEDSFKHKRIPKEYLLSSILFAFSNASGLAFSMTCMNYTNYPNLYFAIIGSRGDTKSEPMDIATYPLVNYDNQKYKDFLVESEDNKDETNKMIRKRLLIQNATIEAMKFEHSRNPYSIGIYYDELMFIFEKMANNKSSEGADLRTFLLSGFNNKFIDISRRSTDNFRMEKTYPTLLGSIQNEFVSRLFGNGNLESGLIDRILFVPKLTSNSKLSKSKIDQNTINSYNKLVNNLLEYRFDIENTLEMDNVNVKLSPIAEQKIYEYTQKLIGLMDESNETIKGYIAKLMISVHKLTLLVHLIHNSQNSNFQSTIKPETADTAILLCEFYFNNFKIIIDENRETTKKVDLDAVLELSIKNDIPQVIIANLMGVSESKVSRHKKEILRKMQVASNPLNNETTNKDSP